MTTVSAGISMPTLLAPLAWSTTANTVAPAPSTAAVNFATVSATDPCACLTIRPWACAAPAIASTKNKVEKVLNIVASLIDWPNRDGRIAAYGGKVDQNMA